MEVPIPKNPWSCDDVLFNALYIVPCAIHQHSEIRAVVIISRYDSTRQYSIRSPLFVSISLQCSKHAFDTNAPLQTKSLSSNVFKMWSSLRNFKFSHCHPHRLYQNADRHPNIHPLPVMPRINTHDDQLLDLYLPILATAQSSLTTIQPLILTNAAFAPDEEELALLTLRISMTYLFLATELEAIVDLVHDILDAPNAPPPYVKDRREAKSLIDTMETRKRRLVLAHTERARKRSDNGRRLLAELQGLAMEVPDDEGGYGGRGEGDVKLMESVIRAEFVVEECGDLVDCARDTMRNDRQDDAATGSGGWFWRCRL